MHSGVCYLELPVCYGCGMRGHIQRNCRVSHQGACRGTTQSSSPAAATSSVLSPARGAPTTTGRGATRGGVQSSRGPSQFYVMSGLQTAELLQMLLQLHEPFSMSTLVGESITVA
uniref:Uncharacterized protein LOC104211451 n=1 Tax=Nicotiana sylvestris TaxID=4096 RepID=A0A1U7UXB0_NICSY|nr:PREDICTED: uncharacterized protein LOC104211451 [Nicotiana sylvestris]